MKRDGWGISESIGSSPLRIMEHLQGIVAILLFWYGQNTASKRLLFQTGATNTNLNAKIINSLFLISEEGEEGKGGEVYNLSYDIRNQKLIHSFT